MMKKSSLRTGFALAVLLMACATLASAEPMKPFVMAWQGEGDVAAKVTEVRKALTGKGFEIVGTYSPYKGATILAITSGALKSAAGKSKHGGYGAVQRVTVTQVGGKLQVAYTNPVYMAAAYRMSGDLSAVGRSLSDALGSGAPYGPSEGLTAEKLREYHYMFGMEYFDDPSELREFESHAAAVDAVEAGLAAGNAGASKVYRVDIPGKEEVVFGVGLTRECSGDEYIMKRIDFKDLRSTGHLPYEILVSGKTAYALFARYRIAINFPDLKMMGDNSFMSIMCAPGEIEDALEEVVGKK